MENAKTLYEILKYLPAAIRGAIMRFTVEDPDGAVKIEEIRIRKNGPLSLTVGGRNAVPFDDEGKAHICTPDELFASVRLLCEDSLHSFDETIKEGYMTVNNGYRVGVCGMASGSGGRITGIYSINSLCIRIPHRYRGTAAELSAILLRDRIYSALIYSPPGVGKTTILRDFAISASSGKAPLRIAVIDTRGEIYDQNEFCDSLCDAFVGYPRGKGIEIATITMSPELIICDEIGADEEAAAMLSAQNSGVPLLASAHGADAASIICRPNIRLLCEKKVFDYLIRIERNENGGFSLYPSETAAVL